MNISAINEFLEVFKGNINENVHKYIFRQALKAFYYLNSKGIFHIAIFFDKQKIFKKFATFDPSETSRLKQFQWTFIGSSYL